MFYQSNRLLDFSILEKYDTKKMYQVYDKWPEIAEESFKNELVQVDSNEIEHIVFAGMGGSGAMGDIFASILSKTSLHVEVVKGYHLPKNVNSNTLVVTTSISGDTVETLSVLDFAKKADCRIIAFSSGGKMQNYCKQNSLEFRNIPKIHSPRASFSSFLFSMLKVLSPIIPINKNEINDSLLSLKKLRSEISSSSLTDENQSLKLAEWITEIPMIYYPWGLQAVAIRFKNSLQENSKKHAITEDIIEACHNGIVSWEAESNIQPILIQGYNDYFKTKERWSIIKQYFHENNIEYKEIFSIKGGILSKLISLIYLFDFATIYNAAISKIDPSPIRSIDYIKNKL